MTAHLSFAEAKGASFVAYYGNKNDQWRFPNGDTWIVNDKRMDHVSGFKGVTLSPTGRPGTLCMAFAGTEDLKDVMTDAQQVATAFTPRQYDLALEWATEVAKSAGNALVFSGHSLGGGLATYCSIGTKCRAYTVNPAPLLNAMSLAGFQANIQITHYVANWEFVSSSMGFNPGTVIEVPHDGSNVLYRHKLGNVCPKVALPEKI